MELILGGDGDINSATELTRQLGLSERVRFLGWVSGADKEARLAAATVFVLPSYNEGLPMSVLEAMSWGIPIVATPVGGIKEIVRHEKEGIIVDPGDIKGLTDALRKVLDDMPLRQRLGSDARERIQEAFCDDVVLPGLEKIWMQLGLFPLEH